jgi:hypothetical protein
VGQALGRGRWRGRQADVGEDGIDGLAGGDAGKDAHVGDAGAAPGQDRSRQAERGDPVAQPSSLGNRIGR